MNTLDLQILAGVPITKQSSIMTEKVENKGIARIISGLIKRFDTASDTTKNREAKTLFNSAASDLEDILAVVKLGKQNKATKYYNQLNSTTKGKIKEFLDNSKYESIQTYFSSVNEDLEDVEQSTDTAAVTVQCPFCACDTTIGKIDFYDHIIDNHVEEETSKDEPEEIEISFGEQPDEDTQLTSESVDATVWDKTEDRDESPSAITPDTDKISFPNEIKSQLVKEIKELQKEVERIKDRDFETAKMYNITADAMIDVLDHLSQETEAGMKYAQICIGKYMSPIVQKFPKDVYDFIIHGGYDTKEKTHNSLINMFKDIKN